MIPRDVRLAVSLVALASPALADGSALAGRKIVLDPGHAVVSATGTVVNPGAVGRTRVHERDVALAVAETLAALLRTDGADVYLTRSSTSPWREGRTQDEDNQARAEYANSVGADLFLRIHCNWDANPRRRGRLTLYYREDDKPLAMQMQSALVKHLGGPDQGVQRRWLVGFAHAKMASVLVELGYLSNRQEERQLASLRFQSRAADAIRDGLLAAAGNTAMSAATDKKPFHVKQ